MGKELIDLTPVDFVNEGETPNIRAALLDHEGVLPAGSVTALTATNTDDAGNVVGLKDSLDILNANDCTLISTTTFAFSSGSKLPEIGSTVDGATSSASGTLQFVEVTSGAWVDGDAEGFIYISNITGTFQAAENVDINGGTANVLTLDDAGESSAVALIKMEAADTAFQNTGEEDDCEHHFLLLTWTWTDVASVARVGSQEFRYTVRRKPTT